LRQIAARIALALDNALAYQQISLLKDRLARENRLLAEEISHYESFDEIIGQSAVMSEVLEQVRMVADTDSSVLIQGETGTGKELIARAIHNFSPRKAQRMVTMNSAAIPAGLLESELFGHEKGAFTGANAQRVGRFELAHQGTLFLDEVGDIPLELQPKLLRVLQEREIERLGGQKIIPVDVRVIAATSCDLPGMIAERRYRSDLYYRLNVFPIWVPPLRERPEDIAPLARFFVHKYARRLKRQVEFISEETLARLSRHPWPGNVRELQNVIERAVILSRGPELHLPMADLQMAPSPMAAPRPASMPPPLSPDDGSESERDRILRVLRETNGIVAGPKGAAARLGLKRTTLLSRMQRMGISVKSLDEL
jgi:formate hydrogenlyase transcriptional activator